MDTAATEARRRLAARPPSQSLSLQRTSTGWALLDARRQPVFTADGPDARRRCLARASALGLLRLTFDEQLRAA